MHNLKNSSSMQRQEWLEYGLIALRKHFEACGYAIPDKVRISIGFPKGARGKNVIGQCFYSDGVSDKHAEVFVSPAIGTKTASARILDVLAHELCHTVAGPKAKHGSAFKQVATAIGLEGKMTATTAGPLFTEFAHGFIRKHREYPAGNINFNKLEKQTTRLIKCDCPSCGYVARVTRKWIEDAGAPFCGTKAHGRMNADYTPDGDED